MFKILEIKHGRDCDYIKIPSLPPEEFDKLQKALPVEAEILKHKRSLDANGLLWVLCDKIAKKLNYLGQKETKETVYKRVIKNVGVFTDIAMVEEAVAGHCERWQNIGLGWLTEIIGIKDKMITVRNYYGSSSYNTKEMADLINYLKAEAEELGIPTIQEEELQSILKEWGK